MNKIDKIKKKLDTLTDPTKIKPKEFDSDFLIYKCNGWESIHDSMLDSVYSCLNPQIYRLMHTCSNNLLGDFGSKFVKRNIRIQNTDIPGEDLIHKTIKNAAKIHVYSKFTSKEFELFLVQPEFQEDIKPKALKIHSVFKTADWFWSNGLFIFPGLFKYEYHVCSFNDITFIKRINLRDVASV